MAFRSRSFWPLFPVLSAALVVAAGVIALAPLGTPNVPVRWSFDLQQLALPDRRPTNVVVVHMDEQAMQDYGQRPGMRWSRLLHARLVERLAKDGATVVVLDVAMPDPSDAVSDTALARAMQINGRVTIASGIAEQNSGIAQGYTVFPPLEQLRTNAARWGHTKFMAESDRAGRRWLEGPDDEGAEGEASLAWVSAQVAGTPATRDPAARTSEQRWLNYYGSPRPFAAYAMTYTNAESAPAGFFRDKAVFIGGQPETLMRGDITDVFSTPYTKWDGSYLPGVELVALAYANLAGENWLRRAGFWVEVMLLALTGFAAVAVNFVGAPNLRLRALRTLGLALGLALLILGALLLARYWFPWLIPLAIQLPAACLLGTLAALRRTFATSGHPTAVTTQEGTDEAPASARDVGRPAIPDQTLIRCIGEGAYGQVWLARNALGLYHAIKVIYRSRFGTAAPYERALRGIQRFMPISRSHPGFVHLLHVGQNDRAQFFFYVMEAGDDAHHGQTIDPTTYVAKTLAGELRARGSLPPLECLDLLLALTDAVEQLHRHQLVHRDIKPDNIIFVHGRPKLADIDLVTTLSGPDQVSRLGTEGYLAPEGPGTAAADVFSLGRVLYVALTGRPPGQCPELPTEVASRPDAGLYFALNPILCKACEYAVERRYPSAAALQADLAALARKFSA